MALWTIQDQQRIKPIDKNNTHIFEQLQNEVEACDVAQELGMQFYQELKRNISNYATLLNGGSYELNGDIYTFSGLKYAFAYWLYARYVRQSYIQDTFSGLAQHTGEGFQRLSSGELKNQEVIHRDTAGHYWDECRLYLTTLSLDYFPQKSKRSKKISAL